MRTRLLKPGFFTNPELAELPALTRILFEGLWLLADKEGRLFDKPKQIKARVLPFDNCNIDKMLGQLKSAGFISRYEAQGKQCIQVINFEKHQTPTSWEKAHTTSEVPPESKAKNVSRTSEVPSKSLQESFDGPSEGLQSNTDIDIDTDTNTDVDKNVDTGTLALPFPKGWVDHWSVRQWWETFEYRKRDPDFDKREDIDIALHWQTQIEASVKDRKAWTQALKFWDGNKYRAVSVEKLLKRYGEIVEEHKTAARNGSNGKESKVEKGMATVRRMIEEEKAREQ